MPPPVPLRIYTYMLTDGVPFWVIDLTDGSGTVLHAQLAVRADTQSEPIVVRLNADVATNIWRFSVAAPVGVVPTFDLSWQDPGGPALNTCYNLLWFADNLRPPNTPAVQWVLGAIVLAKDGTDIAPFLGLLGSDRNIFWNTGTWSEEACCVAEGSLVRLEDGTSCPIEHLRPGMRIADVGNPQMPLHVTRVIGFSQPSFRFLRLERHALGQRAPSRPLFIKRGHPVLFEGEELPVEELLDRCVGVSETQLAQPRKIFTLCTDRRGFADMQGVGVGTWAESAWRHLLAHREREMGLIAQSDS